MRKFVLLWFLLLVGCSSCRSNITILTGSTCNLPCWHNISPGETSQQDAIKILEGLNEVQRESIVSTQQSNGLFTSKIWFETRKSMIGNSVRGEMGVVNDAVVAMWLTGNLDLTFGNVVDQIGEPEYIVSSQFNKEITDITIYAIYPSRGIDFMVYIKRTAAIKPSVEITTISLWNSDYYEVALEEGWFSMGEYGIEDTKKLMYEWKGYGLITELYPPRDP